MRLLFTIVYTPGIERMTHYYRDRMGFAVASEGPFFVQFLTGPTSFALLAVHADQKPDFEMCFAVDDVERSIAGLRSRGAEFIDELRQQPFGKLIHMRDPEGNVVTLLEPNQEFESGGEPRLSTVLVNTWDFGRTRNFYRDRLGLPVLSEAPHWAEFGTEGARIAVHARAERPDAPAHAAQRAAPVFEVENLDVHGRALSERGGRFAIEPTEETFGLYAESVDPDGNILVFREPATVVPVPAKVAEAFEDDDAPVRVGMRKPLKKRSKAVSRVVLRPDYKSKAAGRRKPKARRATPASTNGKSGKLRTASVRGAGPAGARLAPKKTSDAKRARAKPAIGRLRKAERRTLSRKKRAVASVSKRRPVKRAAARRGGRSG